MGKTKATRANVSTVLDRISDEERRNDCALLVKMLSKITGEKPVLWGTKIIGFGSYHYKYESGLEGDSCVIGFASGKPNISVYLVAAGKNQKQNLMKLGKHRMAKACLYIRRLSDVDLEVLEKLANESVQEVRRRYAKSAKDGRVKIRGKNWKKKSTISADKFKIISSAVMKCLAQSPIKYTALAKLVESKVKNFEGSVGWYVMSCLRELEVQGKVNRTSKGYSKK